MMLKLAFAYLIIGMFSLLFAVSYSGQAQADLPATNSNDGNNPQTKDSFYLVYGAATVLAGVVVFFFLRGEKKDAQMVAVLKEHGEQTLKIIEANTNSTNAATAAQNNMASAINSLKDNVTEAILQATQRDVRDEKRRIPK